MGFGIIGLIALAIWGMHRRTRSEIWWNDTYPDTPPPGWLEPGKRAPTASEQLGLK
jgi:hypothetical protein